MLAALLGFEIEFDESLSARVALLTELPTPPSQPKADWEDSKEARPGHHGSADYADTENRVACGARCLPVTGALGGLNQAAGEDNQRRGEEKPEGRGSVIGRMLTRKNPVADRIDRRGEKAGDLAAIGQEAPGRMTDADHLDRRAGGEARRVLRYMHVCTYIMSR
jgi:hypothetical protein